MAGRVERSSRWHSIKKLCRARDEKANARCWICGGRIDYNASNNPRSPRYSPDAYEPDHVLAVVDHPELELDMNNIRASHASCNRARGKKNMNKKTSLHSRDWGI